MTDGNWPCWSVFSTGCPKTILGQWPNGTKRCTRGWWKIFGLFTVHGPWTPRLPGLPRLPKPPIWGFWESWESRESRESRKSWESRESRESRESWESRESRESGSPGSSGVQRVRGIQGVWESYQLLGYPLPDVYSNKVKEQLTYFMRKNTLTICCCCSLLLFHTHKKTVISYIPCQPSHHPNFSPKHCQRHNGARVLSL